MLFVSNMHVLMKFKGGKVVTLLANGSMIDQGKTEQSYLEGESHEIVGESHIYKEKKTVLVEIDQGEDSEFVVLQFDQTGKARTTGKFDAFKE